MSVILIALPACVKEDSSAKEAENKLNQILKDETEKFIVAHVSRDISHIFLFILITCLYQNRAGTNHQFMVRPVRAHFWFEKFLAAKL